MECLETLIQHYYWGPRCISPSTIFSGCAVTRKPRLQRPFYQLTKCGFQDIHRSPQHSKKEEEVYSQRSTSTTPSNITTEALDGIYLALASLTGAELLGNPVSNGQLRPYLQKCQGRLRAATRQDALVADGVPRNPNLISPLGPWMQFISHFHML
jgi:hypothetical protein